MAKITVHGGATDKTLPREAVATVIEPEEDLIALALAVVEERVDEPTSSAEETAVEEVPLPGYAAWLITDLRDELAERGLTKSGNKDELVDRLVADDTARSQVE